MTNNTTWSIDEARKQYADNEVCIEHFQKMANALEPMSETTALYIKTRIAHYKSVQRSLEESYSFLKKEVKLASLLIQSTMDAKEKLVSYLEHVIDNDRIYGTFYSTAQKDPDHLTLSLEDVAFSVNCSIQDNYPEEGIVSALVSFTSLDTPKGLVLKRLWEEKVEMRFKPRVYVDDNGVKKLITWDVVDADSPPWVSSNSEAVKGTFDTELERRSVPAKLPNSSVSGKHVRTIPAPVSFKDVEGLAVEHETFGFGQVDYRGYTTHGFDPSGIEGFVKALLELRDDQWLEMLQKQRGQV